jgi:penicillin-binding protein-related factor A (putative recombinase)
MSAPKKVRVNNYNTGIAAEYFVLSQLYRQNIEAYITIGNKKSIDIRIIKKDGTPISLDVKAVRGYTSLIVNNITHSPNHYFAFVVYNERFENIEYMPEIYILHSMMTKDIIKQYNKELRIMKGDILGYLNQWELLK